MLLLLLFARLCTCLPAKCLLSVGVGVLTVYAFAIKRNYFVKLAAIICWADAEWKSGVRHPKTAEDERERKRAGEIWILIFN